MLDFKRHYQKPKKLDETLKTSIGHQTPHSALQSLSLTRQQTSSINRQEPATIPNSQIHLQQRHPGTSYHQLSSDTSVPPQHHHQQFSDTSLPQQHHHQQPSETNLSQHYHQVPPGTNLPPYHQQLLSGTSLLPQQHDQPPSNTNLPPHHHQLLSDTYLPAHHHHRLPSDTHSPSHHDHRQIPSDTNFSLQQHGQLPSVNLPSEQPHQSISGINVPQRQYQQFVPEPGSNSQQKRHLSTDSNTYVSQNQEQYPISLQQDQRPFSSLLGALAARQDFRSSGRELQVQRRREFPIEGSSASLPAPPPSEQTPEATNLEDIRPDEFNIEDIHKYWSDGSESD